MKVINVPVADRPECRVALDFSFRLAADLSANIVGCHLRPHRSERKPKTDSRFPFLFTPSQNAPIETEKASALSSKAAHALFLDMATKHGFEHAAKPRLGTSNSALWTEMVGSMDKLFPIVGPVADCSVLSRPKQSATGRGAEFLLSALFHSGKPVLVLPQSPARSVGKRIVIAWNQSLESAHAVSAALPLLVRADAVTIVACGRENRPGPKAKHMVQYLNMWGVKCTRVNTKGQDVQAEIEAEFKDSGGDLLVMGGYSRSRLRELVFGGMTHHMLFKTSMPVFMLHS
jgi:nucleotide-binding universal stress UspA family protein